MNVNEASKRTGVSKDMIRFYEKKGMLKPKRNSQNNYRIYDDQDLNLIVLIHDYSSIGMSLKSIAKLIKEHDIREAAEDLDESIKRLLNEEMWIHAKINNAIDMAKLLDMVKNDVSYDIGERDDMYCYSIRSTGFGNVHSYLAERGGIARAVFRVKRDFFESTDWPEDHALLFTPHIEELGAELELIPKHKYYRTILKHDKHKKLGYEDVKSIISDIEGKGCKMSGDMYIYQIMGSTDYNVQDYVCIEFNIQ
ncbi:MAG: MerR family transcriptional regulator [Lachnospiraceae bacterium]|nr:MerR family transcriptional regulator [Lachnospiraceae bacterium]